MKVRMTLILELDDEAQEAWMLNYGIEKSEIREDVKQYVKNHFTQEDFKDRIGAPIKVSWK